MNSRFLISVYKLLPRPVIATIVRMVKPTYPIGVVAVVFDEEKRILFLRHTYHEPAWRLPGGLMERGEDPAAVAVRELMEEANCQIESLGVIDASHEAYTFDVVVLGRLVKEGPFEENAEICDKAWLRFDEMPPLASRHLAFIERARAFLCWRDGQDAEREEYR
jgi:8-oxo-dGTP pyrophosphatase MutT (NUDIX family)